MPDRGAGAAAPAPRLGAARPRRQAPWPGSPGPARAGLAAAPASPRATPPPASATAAGIAGPWRPGAGRARAADLTRRRKPARQRDQHRPVVAGVAGQHDAKPLAVL